MTEVQAIVASLWELDEDQLEAQIGSRVQAIRDNVVEAEGRHHPILLIRKDDFAGGGPRGGDLASLESIDVNVATRASIDPIFLDAGRQLFDRINPFVYQLMCKPLGDDPETQKILDETINQNYTKAAGMLAPV